VSQHCHRPDKPTTTVASLYICMTGYFTHNRASLNIQTYFDI
jgi:hypothetical protein